MWSQPQVVVRSQDERTRMSVVESRLLAAQPCGAHPLLILTLFKLSCNGYFILKLIVIKTINISTSEECVVTCGQVKASSMPRTSHFAFAKCPCDQRRFVVWAKRTSRKHSAILFSQQYFSVWFNIKHFHSEKYIVFSIIQANKIYGVTCYFLWAYDKYLS